MLRRSTWSHARPTLLLVLFAVALPIHAARSQDRALQDRLDRLERDLSMLQRQVYRGGGGPAIGTGSSAAVDTEVRMDRLETEMRDLTGRVEDATNTVEQLRRRVEQINSDIDVRFGQGQGQPTSVSSPRSAGGGAVASASAGTPSTRGPSPVANPPSATPGSPIAPGTLVPPPPYTPTGPGTLTPPGATELAPDPASAGMGTSLRPPSGVLPAGSALTQYNFAFGLLKQADYSAAEEALKSFIRQHPDDGLAGSAQYWLGETYYARGNYAEAAGAFAEGYKRYPKGVKAADDLLKLGMSLARANQRQNACIAFVQLDRDFPNPGSAIKERAKEEKKKLSC
jgi:tol-pal system protein YbgF